ncbi:biliverdin-producing heme oxygenase [Christiangramia salexigens]|nr:biliverdin-producing heme oxygenase [Christiangramia salexigens]
MLSRLREATAQQHKDLEKENLANKIMDHSIDIEEYKLLLFQNYLAYCKVEKELVKYLDSYEPVKTRKLKKDLMNLGIEDLDCEDFAEFYCKNEAEAMGAAYVVEGSAMGGMLIGKEITACENLRSVGEQNFFDGKRESIKNWNDYLKLLRSRDFTQDEIEAAAKKAVETFELFGKAFSVSFSQY